MKDKDIPRGWCEHTETKMIAFIERVVLDNQGHHTNFHLLKCKKCGKFTGFPNDNYEMAIKAGWRPWLRWWR